MGGKFKKRKLKFWTVFGVCMCVVQLTDGSFPYNGEPGFECGHVQLLLDMKLLLTEK